MNNWEIFLLCVCLFQSHFALGWLTTLSKRIMKIEELLFYKDWEKK